MDSEKFTNINGLGSSQVYDGLRYGLNQHTNDSCMLMDVHTFSIFVQKDFFFECSNTRHYFLDDFRSLLHVHRRLWLRNC